MELTTKPRKKRNRFSSWKKKHRAALDALYFYSDGRCNLCNSWIPYIEGQATRRMGNHATFDHIIPLEEGGENNMNNLRMICYDCNQSQDYLRNPKRYMKIKRLVSPR